MMISECGVKKSGLFNFPDCSGGDFCPAGGKCRFLRAGKRVGNIHDVKRSLNVDHFEAIVFSGGNDKENSESQCA